MARILSIAGLIASIMVIGITASGCDFPRCGVMWPCDGPR